MDVGLGQSQTCLLPVAPHGGWCSAGLGASFPFWALPSELSYLSQDKMHMLVGARPPCNTNATPIQYSRAYDSWHLKIRNSEGESLNWLVLELAEPAVCCSSPLSPVWCLKVFLFRCTGVSSSQICFFDHVGIPGCQACLFFPQLTFVIHRLCQYCNNNLLSLKPN